MFKDFGVVERAMDFPSSYPDAKLPTCEQLGDLEKNLGPGFGVEINYKTGKITGCYNPSSNLN